MINPLTSTVTANIAVGTGPYGLSFNPSGTRAYVTGHPGGGQAAVSVIDTAADAVIGTVSGFSNPTGTATSADGGTLYVSDYATNSVDVVSTATNTITSSIPVGSNPYALTANPNGSAIYAVPLRTPLPTAPA